MQGDYLIKSKRSSLAIKPAHLGDGGGASCEDHMGVCLAWVERQMKAISPFWSAPACMLKTGDLHRASCQFTGLFFLFRVKIIT